MLRDQIALFAETLEERIPADHRVRILDEMLDQMDWAEWEGKYHFYRSISGNPHDHSIFSWRNCTHLPKV